MKAIFYIMAIIKFGFRGSTESKSKKFKIDVINLRNEDNIWIFIANHIESGTHIIIDGWLIPKS